MRSVVRIIACLVFVLLFHDLGWAQLSLLPTSADADVNPSRDGAYVLKTIWANPQLKTCTKLLTTVISELSQEDLNSLRVKKKLTKLPKHVETVLKKHTKDLRPDGKDAQPYWFHWNIGKPISCRFSIYQDLGAIKAYLPELNSEVVVKNSVGKSIGQFQAVLAGVHYDFDNNRVTLDPSKAHTVLRQVFGDGYSDRSNQGILNFQKAYEQFEQDVFKATRTSDSKLPPTSNR
jgi:hypothetical protein